jgi:hypothetical protein
LKEECQDFESQEFIKQCFASRIFEFRPGSGSIWNGSGSAEKQILKFTSKYYISDLDLNPNP